MALFTKKFLADSLERLVATFAQAYIAAAVVLPGELFDADSLKVAAGAAVLSLLKSVAASRFGNPDSASLTV